MSEDSGDDTKQGVNVLQDIDKASVAHRPKKSLKDYFHSRDTENKKKNSSKSTQVNFEQLVSENDLCSVTPSDNYWKVLAEKRRTALSEALEENESLHKCVESLTKENAKYKELIEEANSFVEVCKELMSDTANDTGIDVGDVSVCNGTIVD